MEDLILISNLNDFIFCPVSIYFHKLYGNQDNLTYQSQYQINGTKAHEKVDNKQYSTRKSLKMALDVYSDEYKIVGKIDLYDEISKTLIERKNLIIPRSIWKLWVLKEMLREFISQECLIMYSGMEESQELKAIM